MRLLSCRLGKGEGEPPGVKKILTSLLAVAVLTLGGCQGSGAGTGAAKTYKLEGGTVSFVAPPAPWKEDASHDGEGDLGEPKGALVAVGFRQPEHEGFLSVGTMTQRRELVKDPKTKIDEPKGDLVELENDQETLDMLARWVIKRDGEITHQEYIPVGGANAYHMVFEMGKPDKRMKGEQVHFTKGGTHYSISMLAPAKEYSADLPHFQAMVSSFKVEESTPATVASAARSAPATPASTATP